MRRIFKSAGHAVTLLIHLGPRRFYIVLVYWTLRRYRPLVTHFVKLFRDNSKDQQIAQDPILVYQMSKVGSTSLVYSLQFAYFKLGLPKVLLYQAHTLTDLDEHVQIVKNANGTADQLNLVYEYQKIRSEFERDPQQHWNALSITRDPVARHISDFFHHIDRHLPDWRRRWGAGELTVDQVQQAFLASTDHAYYWFDTEIKAVLGVDVFLSPFDCDAGYTIYRQTPKVSLLVLRLEDMDRVAGQAIERFLGIKQFTLSSFNSAEAGGYGDLYTQFKKKLLPTWYVEKAYSGKFASHFYSQAERDRFAKKWTVPNSGAGSLANPSGTL